MANLDNLPKQFNIANSLTEFMHNIQNQTNYGGVEDKNYLTDYHGTFVIYPTTLALHDLPNFKAFKDDVVICGVAKSGASRFSALVGSVMNYMDPDYLYKPPDLQEKVPWLDFCTAAGEKGPRGIDQLALIPSPRAYWTRLNIEAFPPSIYTENAKIVYHLRHPKDTIVTLYHHYLARKGFTKFSGNLSDMIEKMVSNNIYCGPWFQHYALAWKHINDPNVFVCSFEEFSEEPEKSIQRLAKFLGRDLPDATVKRIAHDCHFEQMKRNQFANHTPNSSVGEFDFKVSTFMRSGVVGGWKCHFSREDNQRVNEWMRINLKNPILQGITDRFPSTFLIEDLE